MKRRRVLLLMHEELMPPESIEGVPVPGSFAAREELFGIGRALR